MKNPKECIMKNPKECKCGGTYTDGDIWPSRMVCDRCGDYYDRSGLPRKEG